VSPSPWRAAALAALGVFLVLSAAAAMGGPLPGDATLRGAVLAAASPALVGAARVLNQGGTWKVLLPGFAAVLVAWPSVRARWWLWSAALAVAPLLENVWKSVVARPRPADASMGFPSGHATAAAAFAVLVFYLGRRARLGPRARAVLTAALGAFFLLGVGLARIVLNAHWPSDVVAGWALGTACASAAAWWDLRHPVAAGESRASGSGAPGRPSAVE